MHEPNEPCANLPLLAPSRRFALALLSTDEVDGGSVTCEACRNNHEHACGRAAPHMQLAVCQPTLLVGALDWLLAAACYCA